jgi:hypothetical protein
MAPSRVPYPDRGQGISFFSACCPSHPLDPQTSAAALLSDAAWCETLFERSGFFTEERTCSEHWR